MTPVIVNGVDIAVLRKEIENGYTASSATVTALINKVLSFESVDSGDASAHITAAREMYAVPSNDDIEIDDNPKTSRGENGTWVSAWVWVHDDEVNAELDEDE
jgi:hypothetical protein